MLALGGRYLYWSRIEHRFRTITPGRLYQSGSLSHAMLEHKVEQYGIRLVVDLRNDPPEILRDEEEFLHGHGVDYLSLPTPQVPALETVDAFLSRMELQEGPVLVHCEDGWGRSLLFSALYRVEFEGWSPEEARLSTCFFPRWGNFAPDSPKGRFLSNYRSRLPPAKIE